MNTCSIMQPTYLPWSGYFGLINAVDKFVLLDDVQFERRSWQSRNRILMNGVINTLTVPIRKVARSTIISEIEIADHEEWQASHWKTLQTAYANAPYGASLLSLLEPVYIEKSYILLADLNRRLIEVLCSGLNIKTPIISASSLCCDGARSSHLFAICNEIGCDRYISPRGSADYLAIDEFASMGELSLGFQEFIPRPYSQFRVAEFVSHLSIVDVIANIGWVGALNYIQGENVG